MNAAARAGVVAIAIAMMLAACGGGGGGGSAAPAPPPAGSTPLGRNEALSITSQVTGATYAIEVYLPPQYDANPQARLPVIFAVDGDAQFGYGGNATRFGALSGELQQRNAAAILVGVGGTSRRNTDFLPPGSVGYHQFLTQELVPAIDARYRTDTTKRALSGLSYGGTIVFLAFTYEGAATPTFRYFWSTETAPPNGSATPLADAEAALAAAVQGRPVPVSLFLAGAGSGSTNWPIVTSLYSLLAARHYAGFDLQQVLYGTTHVGADLPAFDDAVARYLN